MTAIKSEYFVDEATGQRYVMSKLGGATNANGDDAANVLAEMTNLPNTLGLYTPARDVFLDWAFGNDTTYSASLTAGSANNGLVLDMRELNSSMRSLVFETEATSGIDYDYTVSFSRDGDAANAYQVAAAVTIATAFNQVNLPESLGYDQYVHVGITPDAAQTGTKLNFKVYLTGRGG